MRSPRKKVEKWGGAEVRTLGNSNISGLLEKENPAKTS